MANAVTMQQLIDASLDTDALEQAVNGAENQDVQTRLNKTYPTLAKAIKTIMQKAPINSTPFATKSALLADTTLADNAFAFVYNDDDKTKNGIYQKISGMWTYAKYNTSAISRIADIGVGKNKYNPNLVVIDRYIGTDGNAYSATGWKYSGLIPVNAGETYTLSANAKKTNGLAFYSTASPSNAVKVVNDDNVTQSTPYTFVVPSDANYIAFNVLSTYDTEPSQIQLEIGSTATTFEAYTDNHVEIFESVLPESVVLKSDLQNLTTSNDMPKIQISGDTATITAKNSGLDVTISATISSLVTHAWSSVFNLKSETVGNLSRSLNDDVAPYGIDNSLVGANHGHVKYTITANNHGKTTADIGSIWTAEGKQWVIVRIVDTNNFEVMYRGRIGGFDTLSPTFTHVSGATNTATINASSVTFGQLYPSIQNRKIWLSIDDKKVDIAELTQNYSNNVTFHESYEIIDRVSLVEWLIANKGVEHLQYGGTSSASVTLDHCFDFEGGYSVTADFLALTDVPIFNDLMFGQSIKLDGNPFFYVPKSLPFSVGGNSYDLTNLTQATFSQIVDFDSSKNESTGILADRILQHDSSHQVGFALGMLPILDANPSVRRTNAVNKALRISTAMKSYLYVVDGVKQSLTAGDYFAAVIYRKHFKVTNRTAQYAVRSKRGDYLYLDWHTAVTERVELPPDYCDRDFTIVETSSNVQILSDTASSNIAVKVDSSKNYGYAILKFI